jgi:hypothetical protein
MDFHIRTPLVVGASVFAWVFLVARDLCTQIIVSLPPATPFLEL